MSEKKITINVNRTVKIVVATAVLTLLVGASLITAAVTIWPESSMVQGAANAFIGGACKPIEDKAAKEIKAIQEELNKYKNAASCIKGLALGKDIDVSGCADGLEGT